MNNSNVVYIYLTEPGRYSLRVICQENKYLVQRQKYPGYNWYTFKELGVEDWKKFVEEKRIYETHDMGYFEIFKLMWKEKNELQ